jgi:hypothetical protein
MSSKPAARAGLGAPHSWFRLFFGEFRLGEGIFPSPERYIGIGQNILSQKKGGSNRNAEICSE